MLLAPSGEGRGCCYTSHNAQHTPTTKNFLAPNVSSAKLESLLSIGLGSHRPGLWWASFFLLHTPLSNQKTEQLLTCQTPCYMFSTHYFIQSSHSSKSGTAMTPALLGKTHLERSRICPKSGPLAGFWISSAELRVAAFWPLLPNPWCGRTQWEAHNTLMFNTTHCGECWHGELLNQAIPVPTGVPEAPRQPDNPTQTMEEFPDSGGNFRKNYFLYVIKFTVLCTL